MKHNTGESWASQQAVVFWILNFISITSPGVGPTHAIPWVSEILDNDERFTCWRYILQLLSVFHRAH